MSVHSGGRGPGHLSRIAGGSIGGSIGGGIGQAVNLSGAPSPFIIGTPASGTLTGAGPSSTITATGTPPGLTINSTARTWAYDGTVF